MLGPQASSPAWFPTSSAGIHSGRGRLQSQHDIRFRLAYY